MARRRVGDRRLGARRQQGGATLIISLIFLLVFAGIAAAVFRSSLTSAQAIGNMQWRAEAVVAANDTIDRLLGTTDFAVKPETLIENAKNSVYYWDANDDKNPDIFVTFPDVTMDGITKKGPRCIRYVPIDNSTLDPTKPADVACIGSSTLSGTATARAVASDESTGIGATSTAKGAVNFCSNSEWSITVRATDAVTNTSVDVVQGVAVRVFTDLLADCN